MRDFIAMLEERREQQASNGGQLKPLIMNDDGEPPMMSDEKAHLFLRGYGFGTAYPFQYTGAGGDRGLDLWSNAAFHGRVDVCAWRTLLPVIWRASRGAGITLWTSVPPLACGPKT